MMRVLLRYTFIYTSVILLSGKAESECQALLMILKTFPSLPSKIIMVCASHSGYWKASAMHRNLPLAVPATDEVILNCRFGSQSTMTRQRSC